jgi:ABC-2 type transport system permease protein
MIDGSDGSVVSSILGYLGQIQANAISRIMGIAPLEKIQLRTRFLFNPELNSQWFIVPGLTVVILAILSVLLTALTVAREWENGSMELLLSTPVRPLEIILGKLFPYAGLGLVATTIVYVLARVFFGVPFVGNHFVFLLGCVLFLVACLAQGLLISIATRKQTLAMQFAMLTSLLPTLLLSGFIFQIESMPAFFRYITMILPARWFMIISRDTFLQGSSLADLYLPFFALGGLALLLITFSVKRFKRDVEP